MLQEEAAKSVQQELNSGSEFYFNRLENNIFAERYFHGYFYLKFEKIVWNSNYSLLKVEYFQFAINIEENENIQKRDPTLQMFFKNID